MFCERGLNKFPKKLHKKKEKILFVLERKREEGKFNYG